MLLFGAGASNGSLGMSKCPPLNKDLFGELRKTYPYTWGKVSHELDDVFNKSFEEGMDALNNQDPNVQPGIVLLWRDVAIYFSKFKIDDTNQNLYCRLFHRYNTQLLNGDIVLSTLNYDCLIESALINSGIKNINYIDGNMGVKLRKIHGSCNFIPLRFNIAWENLTWKANFDTTINTEIKFVFPEKVEAELSKTVGSAMSLIHQEKKNMICPGKIQQIQNEFREFVAGAKAIISIGVKPNPDPVDGHIWDPVSNSSAQVFFVGNKDKCQDWIKQRRNSNGYFIGDRFKSSFDKICEVIDDNFI